MYREISCGVILYKNDYGIKYVLIRDRNGNITFPKGHLQQGETTRECAIRETKEEVGLDVKLKDGIEKKIVYVMPNGVTKEVIFYVADIDEAMPFVNDDEISEVYVEDYLSAMNMLTFDNLKDLLQTVDNTIRSDYAYGKEIKDEETNRKIKSVLSKPHDNSVSIRLGEKEYKIKELWISIYEWLEIASENQKKHDDFNLRGYNDSQVVNCTVTLDQTYIYTSDKEIEVVNIKDFEFMQLLLNDIKNNINAWVEFEAGDSISDREYITLKTQKLKLLIEKAYCVCFGKKDTESFKRLCNHIETINTRIKRHYECINEQREIDLFEMLNYKES